MVKVNRRFRWILLAVTIAPPAPLVYAEEVPFDALTTMPLKTVAGRATATDTPPGTAG